MTLLLMCLQFMKTGLFAIGGGLATIPFLYEISDRFGWFTHQDILNYIAIAEATPGAVGINMSTFAGFTTNGWYGGILATFSLILPSIVVILIVAKILDKFKENRFVTGCFHILRPASTALIAAAGFNVLIIVFFGAEKITFDMFGTFAEFFAGINWIAIAMCAVVFVLMKVFKKVHPIVFIFGSALMGIVLKM